MDRDDQIKEKGQKENELYQPGDLPYHPQDDEQGK